MDFGKIDLMQKYMKFNIDDKGMCYVCPKRVYRRFFGTNYKAGSCASEAIDILHILKTTLPPESIANIHSGVDCKAFFDWFLKLKARGIKI